MAALADRQFRRHAVVRAGHRDEDELLVAGVEAEERGALSAGPRQDVVQQKGRGRVQVGRLRQRRQEREMRAGGRVQRSALSAGRRRQSAFSNFSLMLTKLYGGHGPEYLNDNTSSYLRLV